VGSANDIMNILLVTEQRHSKWNLTSFETLVAAKRIAQHTNGKVTGVVIGRDLGALADELSSSQLDDVLIVEHDLLDKYTPDGYSLALKQVIESVKPDLVLLPHTYQVRDFAPKLAASLQRSMIDDCIGYRYENSTLVFVRQMFQGRSIADVIFTGNAPWIVSFQAGAFRADETIAQSVGNGIVRRFDVDLEPEQIRTKPEEPFREGKQAVDLAKASVLVSVGRGIKAPENLVMVQKLAALLGAELSGSRPVCDEGWLSMDRQVGSSGQTVAPKLYLALGISGAIQHVVGIKGARTIAAINKDANAPIFKIADYGVVGDIFEVVPALIKALEREK
jgi:electron transfer flavoprotein alpha subunit